MRCKRRARAYLKYARIAAASAPSAQSAARIWSASVALSLREAGISHAAVGAGVGVGDASAGALVGARVGKSVGTVGAGVGASVAMPGAFGIFKIIPVRKRVVVVMSFALAINGYFDPLPYTFCAMIQSESPDWTVYVCSLAAGSVAAGVPAGAGGVAVGATRVGGAGGVSFAYVGIKIGVGKTYGRLVGSSVGACADASGARAPNVAMLSATKIATTKNRAFICTRQR